MQRKLSLLALLLAPTFWQAAAQARDVGGHHSPAFGECLVLDIRQSGAAGVARLTDVPGLEAWLELDTEFFACGSTGARTALSRLAPVLRDLGVLEPARLRLAFAYHRNELAAFGVRVLATGGRFAVVEIPEEGDAETWVDLLDLQPFVSGRVLARQRSSEALLPRSRIVDESVSELVDEVDSTRWFDDVMSLVAYNRFTHGEEIDAARSWLEQQFEGLPGMRVESQEFGVQDSRVFNVVATLAGRSRPDDWYIVGGHYDSTSEAPFMAAPGAEDNASGCAGILELARIFSSHPPEATILFICYAGEEQGLFGSVDHVERLEAGGNAEKVRAMISLDMIGFDADADLGCILEADATGQELVDALAAAADRHTSLRISTSIHRPLRPRCCSDHAPYARAGMLAVLAIEDDSDIYPHFHRSTDLPEHLSLEMAEQILRMTAGFLALATGTAELSGCIEAQDEPLEGVEVILSQAREPRRRRRSDRQGCFAFDGLTDGKKFKLQVRGARLAPAVSRVSACATLRGEPLSGRPGKFRQRGEPPQSGRSDEAGCVAFDAVPASFKLIVKGPRLRG